MKRRLHSFVSEFDAHALERQQSLAWFVIGIDCVVAAVWAITAWDSRLSETDQVLFGVAVALSLVALLLAGNVVGSLAWIRYGKRKLPGHGERKPGPREKTIAHWRPCFYFAGVLLNLGALAFLIDLTGGLAESPFVAMFVAFVLTAMQLSRLPRQTLFFLVFGALVAFALLIHPSGSHVSAHSHAIEVALVLVALGGGALLTYDERREEAEGAAENSVGAADQPPAATR